MKIPYNEELRPDTGLYNAKLGIWLFLASEVMLFGALFSAYIMLRISDPSWSSYTVDHDGHSILNVPLATLNTVILISSSVTMVMSWVALKMNNFYKYKMYMGLTLICSFAFLFIKYIEYSSKFAHDPPLYPSTNNFMAIYFTLTGLHMLHVIGGILVNYYLWKEFDDVSKEKTSKWFNGLSLLCLLLPWGYITLGDAEVAIRGYETNIGTLLFGTYALSLLSSKIDTLKPYNYIFAGFGFFVACFSMIQFSGYGYYLFLIISGITFFDSMLRKPHASFDAEPERFTNRVEIAGLYWHFVDLVWIFLFPALYLL